MRRLMALLCAILLALSCSACSSALINDAWSPSDTSSFSPSVGTNASLIDTGGPYTTGTHHIIMVIKGYGKLTLEIYSDEAPKSADFFCSLVTGRYYDGRRLFWILNNMYVAFGDAQRKTKGKYNIAGEYKEAGVDNNISLKRGMLALARANNKKSDATKVLLFLSDCSYLDDKYAAFGKVSDGMDIIDKICDEVGTGDDAKIKINKHGEILNRKQCPVIYKMRMID